MPFSNFCEFQCECSRQLQTAAVYVGPAFCVEQVGSTRHCIHPRRTGTVLVLTSTWWTRADCRMSSSLARSAGRSSTYRPGPLSSTPKWRWVNSHKPKRVRKPGHNWVLIVLTSYVPSIYYEWLICESGLWRGPKESTIYLLLCSSPAPISPWSIHGFWYKEKTRKNSFIFFYIYIPGPKTKIFCEEDLSTFVVLFTS